MKIKALAQKESLYIVRSDSNESFDVKVNEWMVFKSSAILNIAMYQMNCEPL